MLVWSDWRHWRLNSPEIDIYGYNLERGEEFPLIVGPGTHLYPRISGNWVIYLDWPPGANLTGHAPDQPTLRAYHLPDGETIEIGSAYYSILGGCCQLHSISAQQIIWRAADTKVYHYDLVTRQKRLLAIGPHAKLDLHGNVLYAGDIYNIDTGAALKLFQPSRPERPTAVSEVATDGQTVAWLFDGAVHAPLEGRIYVARLKRVLHHV
jgi:hypothetical protein